MEVKTPNLILSTQNFSSSIQIRGSSFLRNELLPYLFLEETGWVGSFHLMTCNLIVRILSDKSTHVYIKYITCTHRRSRSDHQVFPFRNLVHAQKIFLQKIFLVFSKNKCWHEKIADTNKEFQWLTSIGAHLFSLEQRGKCDPVQSSPHLSDRYF